MITSTISAFQKVLQSFRFGKPEGFPEEFAQARFFKKFQKPDHAHTKQLAQKAYADWREFDENLTRITMQEDDPFWVAIKGTIHSILNKHNQLNASLFRWPQGSEFSPTRGFNTIEDRLRLSQWDCTPNNFEAFARLCYDNRALRFAAKRRWQHFLRTQQCEPEVVNRQLYLLYRHCDRSRIGYRIFRHKLQYVVQMQPGSRFSTVPKNNEKRRPINIECFANVLTQSQVGENIRNVLRDQLRIDLDTLAETHRMRVSQPDRWATIDFQNASDSISMKVVDALFPRWFVQLLRNRRSEYILGLDGQWYKPLKLSSMGNGFTFEVMSFLLTVIARSFDQEASSFGDDVVIHPSNACDFIMRAAEIGFVVNEEKSFIGLTDPFRESCGANFHKDYGYISSFDFEWPTTIGECVVIFNKAYHLGTRYKSFRNLYNSLLRVLNPALRGTGPSSSYSIYEGLQQYKHTHYDIEPWFIYTKGQDNVGSMVPSMKKALAALQKDVSAWYLVRGFRFQCAERRGKIRDLSSRQWATYYMYLHDGRRSVLTRSGQGEWKVIWFVTNGSETIAARSLKG